MISNNVMPTKQVLIKNFLKIYNKSNWFFIVLMFLYANFLLLFVFALNINPKPIISLSPQLLSIYTLMLIGGFCIHDIGDQKADRLANKFNFTLLLNKYILFIIAIITWTLGFYLVYSISPKASFFIIMQYISIILYSAPFPRLKEKGILGVISNALSEHVFMEIILLIIIQQFAEIPFIMWGSFLLFTFSVGVVGLLTHQLIDFENDINANIITFAIENRNRAKAYIKLFEYIALGSLLLLLVSVQFLNFSIVFFSLFIVLSFSYIVQIISNKSSINNILIKNYIIVSSFFFSYLLILNGNYIGFLLLIHPYFLSFIKRVLFYISSYISSYKHSFDFIIFGFITCIRFIVNYSLYYTFLVFRRNLKKKPLINKSFIDFLFKK